MHLKHWASAVSLALATACGGSATSSPAAAHADAAASTRIAGNVPSFVSTAPDLGAVDPATVISVTAWLKLQHENQLDQLVVQQQTKGHPNFHRWLTQDQFNAQFSPTAQQVSAVTSFLTAHHLTVIDVAENNFYVRVSGTVADVQKAFNVQLHAFSVNGELHRSNTSSPNDGSGGNIAAVTGLDDVDFRPMIRRAVEPDGTAPRPVTIPLSAASAGPDGVVFSRQCFQGFGSPFTQVFDGGAASYTGNRYGQDISNTALGTLAPCGYSPGDVRAAYDLDALHARGLDGAGQTIVIIDEWGSPTIAQDADAFSQIYGLPRITADNFQVVKAQGLWHNTGNPNWADWTAEVTLDVEWSHAVAPAARIALVVAPDQSLFEALNLAIARGLGNTISNSWSTFEGFISPAGVAQMERILKHAAAKGIDVNFASGDWGDNVPIVGARVASYPASSPTATGIGGTSLAMDGNRQVLFETGWGTNITMIYNTPGPDHFVFGAHALPWNEGFDFGSGSPASMLFAKPSWQTGVPGTTRGVPDIGMLADPFTGVEIVNVVPGQPGVVSVGVIGGTSLACPLFSGLMAIAAQAAGHGLGQAAPLLYGLSSGIKDVVPPSSALNVTGTSQGTAYTADQLAQPLQTSAPYLSAIYNSPFSTRWFVLMFNTDTTLQTTVGWDDVTGLGVPDGASFVSAIAN